MMNLIVTVCRALASRPRLRLLRVLHAQPDQTVQALAANVNMPAESASKHLKVLSSFQLVTARPQGRYVYFAPIKSGVTSNKFLSGLQDLLRMVFRAEPSSRTPAQVCDWAELPAWEPTFDALVKMFTTYTHLRRLLLLRYLATQGPGTVEQLSEQVRMSFDATLRHLRKLQRRAVVAADDATPPRWRLQSDGGSAGQRKLLSLVWRELQARPR